MSRKASSDDSQMIGENWHKEVTLKVISVRNKQVWCTEYDFFADKIPCRVREGGTVGPMCGGEHTWLQIRGGKVFLACNVHSTVILLSLSHGYEYKQSQVEPEEALEICRETGQFDRGRKMSREFYGILESRKQASTRHTRRRPK